MKWLDALIDKAIQRRAGKLRPHHDDWQPRVACWTCGISHELPGDMRQAFASAEGFFSRHEGHEVNWLEKPGRADLWPPNADVKLGLQAAQTMTVTNLHSLASSATAGWQSAVVDNTSTLFLDALVMLVLDFANTAPANSKGVYVYAYGGLESGTYTNPASGVEGTITLVDVTANAQALRQIGFLPYTTQDEVAESAPMSVAAGFGGILPPFWGVVLMNHSGAALAAAGNTVKYRGVYATVI